MVQVPGVGGREPRVIARNESVVCDFGGVLDGYCSDITRTVFTADDTKEAMRLAEIGLAKMRHRLAATGNLSSGNLVGDRPPVLGRRTRHRAASVLRTPGRG